MVLVTRLTHHWLTFRLLAFACTTSIIDLLMAYTWYMYILCIPREHVKFSQQYLSEKVTLLVLKVFAGYMHKTLITDIQVPERLH